MKIKLDPWQQKVLDHKGDIGLCTGRRVGKTYILARKAIDHMMEHGKPFIVVSLTEDQAMIIIEMAHQYAKQAYPKDIGRGKYKRTLKTLTMIKDKRPVKMISRPVGNTGDSMRGFEGGVLFVDEASRMPKMFWMAALPVLLTCAGEIWMCSTPHGKQGYFWKRFNEVMNLKDPKARFTFFYETTTDVIEKREISESWTEEQRAGAFRILEEDKKDMSDLEFGQEYLGLFMDEIRQLFSEEWIEDICTIEYEEEPKPNKRQDYFFGGDVGRVTDPSTFHCLDGTNEESIKQLFGYAITPSKEKILKIPETFREIRRQDRIWDFNKIGIDSGGMGAGVLDLLLEDDDTRRKSEGLDNAMKVVDAEEKSKPLLKEDMYIDLLVKGEKREINLLKNSEIMMSLRSIQYEYVGKNMKIHGKDTHHVEGIIRALRLIKTKGLKPFITSL